MKKFPRIVLVICFLWIGTTTSAWAVTELSWWHAMQGHLGDKVTEIADGFNHSQDEYRVIPDYKGDYATTMEAGITAFQAGNPPHILQVYEVGTATMMAAKGAIKPVQELMEQYGATLGKTVFIPGVSGYYSSTDSGLLSLPFNSSTPLLFYNKDAFKKAGLDPNKPPQTWFEVETVARKLIRAGYPCGFSSAWVSWIHLENLGAWHNVPMGSRGNGFEGLDTQLHFNTPLFVRHIKQLKEWQKEGIFVYNGRGNKGNDQFIQGKCAMYTESSAGYASFKAKAPFEFGTSMLPFWPDVPGAPQNTIIGGGSLWTLAGHSEQDYQGIARFFAYLTQPTVQADWHLTTGYLPITIAAFLEASKSKTFLENPGSEKALLSLTLRPQTRYSMGVRFGNMVWLRDRIAQELEDIFSGKKSTQKGLDDAVAEGNKLLHRFAETNGG